MEKYKSTNKELVEELIVRNQDGKYDQLIANARNNLYHDFKSTIAFPKMQFIIDTEPYAQELHDLREAVKNDEYEERPDQDDTKAMREGLLKDGTPDAMFEILGFAVPTRQERAYWNARNRSN